jgi:hypothetical protein
MTAGGFQGRLPKICELFCGFCIQMQADLYPVARPDEE